MPALSLAMAEPPSQTGSPLSDIFTRTGGALASNSAACRRQFCGRMVPGTRSSLRLSIHAWTEGGRKHAKYYNAGISGNPRLLQQGWKSALGTCSCAAVKVPHSAQTAGGYNHSLNLPKFKQTRSNTRFHAAFWRRYCLCASLCHVQDEHRTVSWTPYLEYLRPWTSTRSKCVPISIRNTVTANKWSVESARVCCLVEALLHL